VCTIFKAIYHLLNTITNINLISINLLCDEIKLYIKQNSVLKIQIKCSKETEKQKYQKLKTSFTKNSKKRTFLLKEITK
jgi:hypothetical protein